MIHSPTSVIVRNKHLLRRIAEEQARREHKTASRTLEELAKERLAQIDLLPQTARRRSA